MRHLLDPTDFTVSEIDKIINCALDIIENKEKYASICQGKILATLFYEPSTRTRLSFETAMLRLGGSVIGFSDAANSSVSKGETVADTIRVISRFADIVAMRHPKEGAPHLASEYATIPIINAGDGGHSHPTQTLTDLLTIRRELGRFNDLTIGVCGDLKYGRTVHSLVKAMGRYTNVKFVFIAPDELQMPEYIKREMQFATSKEYIEVKTLEEAMPMLDVLYMTRVQQERFDSIEEYNRLKDSYILDTKKMELANDNMIVLHPLPRVNEITPDVDNDPRAAYFRQVENGKFVRMSLIYNLLQLKDSKIEQTNQDSIVGNKCSNSKCISNAESVTQLYKKGEDNVYRCVYCDAELS